MIACFRGRDYTLQNIWSHTHAHTHTHTAPPKYHYVAGSTWHLVHCAQGSFGFARLSRRTNIWHKHVPQNSRTYQQICHLDRHALNFPEVFVKSRATFWKNLQLLLLRFFSTFRRVKLKNEKRFVFDQSILQEMEPEALTQVNFLVNNMHKTWRFSKVNWS